MKKRLRTISKIILVLICLNLFVPLYSQPLDFTDTELRKMAARNHNYIKMSNQNMWIRVEITNYKKLNALQEKKIKSLQRTWFEILWDDINEWVYVILALFIYEKVK